MKKHFKKQVITQKSNTHEELIYEAEIKISCD
jgi:hypothetical protein